MNSTILTYFNYQRNLKFNNLIKTIIHKMDKSKKEKRHM